MLEIPLNLMGSRTCTVCVPSARQFQEGRRHCPCNRARKQGAPPETPSLFHPVAQQGRSGTCFRVGQRTEERLRLLGRPAADLNREHHQPGATRAPNQFRVPPFLPLPRCVQGHSVHGGATWLAVCVEGADDGGVHKLRAAEERQRTCDNLQSPAISRNWIRDVEVSYEDVCGDSSSSPQPRAGCTMVAGSDARLREEGGAGGAEAALKELGSIDVTQHNGQVVRAAPKTVHPGWSL